MDRLEDETQGEQREARQLKCTKYVQEKTYMVQSTQ